MDNNNARQHTPAVLVLADSRTFRGIGFGATGRALGEAVFTTAMTGYQETMSDPSYHKQLVTLTVPMVGNTGYNEEDWESHGDKIWVAGLIIRDLAVKHSNWRADESLEDAMVKQGIVGIRGVDTRALVRHLRNHGSIAAGIFSGDEALQDTETLVSIVTSQPAMEGADLAAEAGTDDVYVVEPTGTVASGAHAAQSVPTVVAYDMGIKSATPKNMAARGLRVVVVPANTPFQDIEQYKPDGVFVSNGPGDPATADTMVGIVREVLAAKIPFFGICFGNQILGRALGLETYKMKFGHRGINVPVKNLITGKIDITSQNHGFALKGTPDDTFETDFGPARVTHVCLNDNTVEGVALENGLAFSVQYHPESAAGPNDANQLFDQFVQLLTEGPGNGPYDPPAAFTHSASSLIEKDNVKKGDK
ncbi:glutamine-hydrolyzing carbamoyl-phosphate synthase small subunit [Corynebacterium glucuronolyticum]|uniref:Carbamoyl phosphate synthase small chain n=2 Tax=Corynebacterium glucuronolyticum TaxID=39791 RepID=A0AAX1L580_9CORY|nr:glutamine-hydrolyzing carbamoyl-phosphate synthase small subunit [Corynebacterium glucuronolyticum]EEI62976.1 carbamoyl-phosphate synthase, small subunit [Corynebacterium glucuronolyticum ATCC 51866]MCT1562576.1 glutamine-hydrolyzing carbamoyl-phosphate synthase small subunit [Corynebacterium glucuronolyticum]QRP69576.1 glutamine-hydrolyzing carbamoyl-phosphate synthase small subunit [Corynebacterium glucuronolyticum]